MQFEELKELIAIFEKSDISEMKIQIENTLIHLNRDSGQAVKENVSNVAPLTVTTVSSESTSASLAKEEKKSPDEENTDEKYIKAPIVGTFYQSASPEKPPYVSKGDKIKKGDIVCIIEAMKFMNEVTSAEDGEILEVLVKDGEFVEFGAPLFKLK